MVPRASPASACRRRGSRRSSGCCDGTATTRSARLSCAGSSRQRHPLPGRPVLITFRRRIHGFPRGRLADPARQRLHGGGLRADRSGRRSSRLGRRIRRASRACSAGRTSRRWRRRASSSAATWRATLTVSHCPRRRWRRSWHARGRSWRRGSAGRCGPTPRLTGRWTSGSRVWRRRCGYHIGFSTRPAQARLADPPLMLPRIEVRGDWDLDAFAAALEVAQ